jgi:hypothetical protein
MTITPEITALQDKQPRSVAAQDTPLQQSLSFNTGWEYEDDLQGFEQDTTMTPQNGICCQ